MVNKEILDIGKLMEAPEFQTFISFVETVEKECDRPCEFYCEHPEMAQIDKGRKIAYASIKNYFLNAKSILEQNK